MERIFRRGPQPPEIACHVESPATHPENQVNVPLLKNEIIYFDHNINEETAHKFKSQLRTISTTKPDQEVVLRINSNGGIIESVFDMISEVRHLRNPVTTIAETRAHSCAALLLASGDKGHRYAYEDTKILLHQIQFSFKEWSGSFPEFERYFNGKRESNETFLQLLADLTGNSLDKVKSDTMEDLYLSAQDAVEYGIIDHVIPIPTKPQRKELTPSFLSQDEYQAMKKIETAN